MHEHNDKHTKASEYLRLVLPLISKHGLAATPPNYALWYEYVAGNNLSLRTFIDELTAAGEKVDQELATRLYLAHVASREQTRIDKAQQALRSLITEVSGSMQAADKEVTRYSSSLEGLSNRLDEGANGDELRSLISGLAEQTGSMRQAGAELQKNLEESRMEAEALREELERAREEANTDALTGLSNRKAFQLAADGIMGSEDEDSTGHCLLMADIDRFKRINDNYGHLLGDKVIKFVAETLRQTVKGKDVVARFGGEEYAILLPKTPLSGAMALAETIRSTVESGRLVRTDTREPIGTVTLSIGVAAYRPGEPLDDLIGRADEALYEAKNLGRNRVQAAMDAGATGTEG